MLLVLALPPVVADDAISREFSVHNSNFDELLTDAITREFSVYNSAFDGPVANVVSREFSVYNSAFDDSAPDAISREFSVYNDDYDSFSDAISREFSVYLPPLTLDINVDPPGAGTTVPSGCTSNYTPGEIIDVIAFANPGYDFDHWEIDGDVLIADPNTPCTEATINDNAALTAMFITRSMITIEWTGKGDGTSWSDPNNWCPPIVPDETGAANYHAVIDGPNAVVNLDMSPPPLDTTVTRLDLLNGAVLRVVAATGSQALSVTDGILNQGILRANDGQTFTISANIDQEPNGGLEIFNAALIRIVDGTVYHGYVLTGGNGLIDLVGAATLDNVGVSGLVVPNGLTISLDGTAINVDTVFIDAVDDATRIDTLSSLTLSPLNPDQAELILGDETFAELGGAGSTIINETGHAIRGAGRIAGVAFTNRAVVEAGPTPAGGTVPEVLELAVPTTNESTLRAAGGFTLNIAAAVDQTSAAVIEAESDGIVEINAPVTGSGTLRASEDGTLNIAAAADCYTLIAQAGSVLVQSASVASEDGVDLPPGLGAAAATLSLDLGTLSCVDGLFVTDGITTLANGSQLTVSDGPVFLCPDIGTDPAAVAELHVDASSIVAATEFDLCDGAILDVGGTLILDDSLQFTNTDDTEWTWGPSAALEMVGGVGLPDDDPTDYARLEIGGEDLGDDPDTHQGNPAGFIDNFHLTELVIGPDAHVRLVDEVVNAGGVLPEALYVETLTFADATGRLDLNGLHLYYQSISPPGSEAQIIDCPLGDAVCDGDVDAEDFAAFQACFGVEPLPPECRRFDLDSDGDVDIDDFDIFAGNMSGPS